MISESLVHLGEKKSGIRELFEYGLRQAAVVGQENVYDYSAIPPSPRRRRSPPSSASFWKATALPCMATRPQAARRRPSRPLPTT